MTDLRASYGTIEGGVIPAKQSWPISNSMFIGINHLKFNFDASRYKSLILLFDQHQNLLAVAH